MPAHSPPRRRAFLVAIASGGLACALTGCLRTGEQSGRAADPEATEPTVDPTAERPLPDELVGKDSYVTALSAAVDEGDFPDPDPSVVPALTKARFVAAASREAGEAAFADRVETVREPALEPLRRFDAITVLASPDRRERLNESQRERLRETVDLEARNVSLSDDQETIISEGLTPRERTFLEYPGPPLHVVEAAESRGLEQLDRSPEDRAGEAEPAHREYVRQFARVEAVVAGARSVATEAYERSPRIRNLSLSGRRYETADDYAAVVAFNAGLAAESMLQTDGELTTPP